MIVILLSLTILGTVQGGVILRQLSPRIHCQRDPVVAGMKNNFQEFNVKLLRPLKGPV
jgi:hypothetical protein